MDLLTGYKTLRFEREGPILTVILNRPEVLNAVDDLMHTELERLWRTVDDDEGSQVVVVTGAGRGFCSGGDIGNMQRSEGNPLARRAVQVRSSGWHLFNACLAVEKPIIAMVNGSAVGLGATIALLCDAVFMGNDAKIGDRHVNVGLVAGDGGAVLWPLLVGPMKAKEALFTGRMIPADEAERLGMVTRAVPANELRAETIKYANVLATMPAYALRATKISINRLISLMVRDSLDLSLAWERASMRTDEHQQAMSDFLEGRNRRSAAANPSR